MKAKGIKNTVGLLIAVVLILVGSIGQKLCMSNLGKTEVEERIIISESGYTLAMDSYIPQNATKEKPAPVIIFIHGGNDDKNLMTRYAMETARRGYVSVTFDMYSHGESEWLPDSEWLTAGRGAYDAVREVYNWPFVDKEKISLMGYSRGGKAAGEALEMDNQELNCIKNIYLLFSDPIYKDSEGFTDVYGARNIAVLADKYDEFFFTEKENDTGVYSNDANRFMETLTSPVNYVENPSAQSFLYFGEDPEGKELRAENTVYEKEYDGITATREIRTMGGDHMQGHYNGKCIIDMLDFFARVEPSPIDINSGSGLYLGYDIFGLVGMIGMLMLLAFIAFIFVERIEFFKSVEQKRPQIALVTGKKNVLLFWTGVIINTITCIFAIWWVNKIQLSAYHDFVFRSARFVYIPAICMIMTVLMILVSVVIFRNTHDLSGDEAKVAATKIVLPWKVVLKTFLLGFIAIVIFYLVAFVVRYFMGTIFKFTLWGFPVFGSGRIPFMILMAPMFVAFYIATSMSNDALGYSSILGKNRTVNNLLTALLAALPMGLVMIYFYGKFRLTGWNPMFGGNSATGSNVYIFPMIVFVLVLLCRKVYEKTGNIYLGAMIAGCLNSAMTVSTCEIRIPEEGEAFSVSPIMLGLMVVVAVALILGIKFFYKLLKEDIK